MSVLGPLQLIDIAIPGGVDGAHLQRLLLEKGITDQSAVALAATLAGQVNLRLQQVYGGMYYITTSPFARYRKGHGTRRSTPLDVEQSKPDPVRGEDIGHMLPRVDYFDNIAWSRLFKRRADPEKFRFSLEEVMDSWVNRVDKDVVTRILTNTEEPVGDAGYSVGWAIGTGTNVNYIPPQHRGFSFDSTHTHYVVVDDSSLNWDTLIESIMEQLRHHGHTGMLTITVSYTDMTAIGALPRFSALEQERILIVGGNTDSPVRYSRGEVQGVPGELVGYYSSLKWGMAEIRCHERFPTGYAFGTKSYGINNPKNGIAVRIEDGVGFGLKVIQMLDRTPEQQLEALNFEATHGVGVWDRTNGVAGYIANGASTWVNPEIA